MISLQVGLTFYNSSKCLILSSRALIVEWVFNLNIFLEKKVTEQEMILGTWFCQTIRWEYVYLWYYMEYFNFREILKMYNRFAGNCAGVWWVACWVIFGLTDCFLARDGHLLRMNWYKQLESELTYKYEAATIASDRVCIILRQSTSLIVINTWEINKVGINNTQNRGTFLTEVER